MRIGILGATGQAGRCLCRWLVLSEFADIVLIGRGEEKLNHLRQQLNPTSGHTIEIAIADAADKVSLIKAFAHLDMVVIAVSSAAFLPVILSAALETKTDCLDILLGSAAKREVVERRQHDFEQTGLTYITDGGYHPGLPGVMARYAETLCPELENIAVYGSFGVDWRSRKMSRATVADFVRELAAMDMGRLCQGKWVSDWRHYRRFDFGDGRGLQSCVPMGMDEIRDLPRYIPSVRNAGFYIAGMGPVIDLFFMPLGLMMAKMMPQFINGFAAFFDWGLRHFGGQKEWARLILQGNGAQGGIDITMTYGDAYALTALPVVACLKQYAQTPCKPGLHWQAHFVEPGQFMADLAEMGVCISHSRRQKRA